MCRYSDHPSKTSMACFGCRKSWKAMRGRTSEKCPQCGEKLHDLGRDFQAPKKSNRKAWGIIEVLFGAGIAFDSCGCSGPGFRPRRRWRVRSFVRDVSRKRGRVKGRVVPRGLTRIVTQAGVRRGL